MYKSIHIICIANCVTLVISDNILSLVNLVDIDR